ncbi:MAG: right-handed parallel beta-helix repeat-containing protein, partial [Hyphomicrobiaceae bacterium]
RGLLGDAVRSDPEPYGAIDPRLALEEPLKMRCTFKIHPGLQTFLVTLILMAADLPTAEAAQFDPPPLKDTAYQIPPDAVFVAHEGNDVSRGTERSPLRTVSAAINAAPAGGTIVIRRGTYREALPELSKPLTLQPYPHEQVWLKGSLVLTGWAADGEVWRKDGWTPEFCNDCFHPDNIDPDFPHAGQPDQVFVDGAPLEQVPSRAKVMPGTFFVDESADRLFIGTSPIGKTVEASAYSTALTIWQDGRGTIIRGLGFAHYAPVPTHGLGATLKLSADAATLENNTFAWSAVKGLEVFGRNVMVRGNTFIHNGMMGIGAWKADGLIVTGNRFAFNNRERFRHTGPVSGAAGASITETRNLTVSDNVFDGNYSNGLWLDINTTNATITRNKLSNNLLHGVFYEISSNGIIASNIATGNGLAGIALSDSMHMKVYNNTLVGNAIGFVVQDGDRVNDDPLEIAMGNSWISGDTDFYNNLVSGAGNAEHVYIWVRDFTAERDADDMLSASGFNGFYRRDRSRPRHVSEWWRGAERMLFSDLRSYGSATGRDLTSIMIDDSPEDPFFMDASSGNLALKPDSVARHAGKDLPRDVAAAIGVADWQSPDLGALLRPGGQPMTP